MRQLLPLLMMVLALGACKPEKAGADIAPSAGGEMSIEGTVWVAEDIGGKGIIDNSHITLLLDQGRASGRGGCNSYSGSYTLNGAALTIGPVASTRMACMAEALMNQEQAYFDLLSKTSGYERTPEGALLLKAADGRTIKFMAE